MYSQTSYTYDTFFITAFIFMVGLVYVYSLFNLYIGRKPQKYKITLLALNFLFLTGYIVLLINIPEYNQVPLILLLIVILAIIVLGLIGAFMFNVDYSIDRSNEFPKQINIFRKMVKIPIVLVTLVFGGILTYEVLSHDVQRLENIGYILDIKETDISCDTDLRFGHYDEADLFLFCDDDSFNTANITEIKIFFDDVLIHENNYTSYSIEEGVVYSFNYDFEEIKEYTEVNEITIVLIVGDDIQTYIFDLYDYIEAYDSVTVPIWVKE